MKSTDFLKAAANIQAERGEQYNSPAGERSMGRTVAAFNAITGKDLTEAEGWLLLQVLKDVRQWHNPRKYHHDSALDGVSFSSLKAEALYAESCKAGEAGLTPGYTVHEGGNIPVPADRRVEVVFRNGFCREAVAGGLLWEHCDTPNPEEIVAYRVIEE